MRSGTAQGIATREGVTEVLIPIITEGRQQTRTHGAVGNNQGNQGRYGDNLGGALGSTTLKTKVSSRTD